MNASRRGYAKRLQAMREKSDKNQTSEAEQRAATTAEGRQKLNEMEKGKINSRLGMDRSATALCC